MFGNRAQAGPGGLSINTSSANSLAPHSSSQPPKSGGLFGSSQQSKPIGSIFGTPAPTSQAQGNSLFGSATSNAGGGLFANTTTTTSQPQSNSLFSSSTTAAPSQQTSSLFGGGLFGGQGANNQQNQAHAPQQGSSLFGGQASQQQKPSLFGPTNNSQQGGGLFGSIGQTQNQTIQPQSHSIFGTASAQNKPASLFSSNAAQNPASTRAQQQPTSAPSIFASSIGQLSQQQQTVPGVRISVNELRPTTRFNDLHEELQKIIEGIDDFVLQQMHFQSDCELAIRHVEEAAKPLPGQVENARTTLDAVQQSLENDAQAVSEVKGMSKMDASNAKLSFNALLSLRLPQQFQRSHAWHASSTLQISAPSLIDDDTEGAATNLIDYFSIQADDMSSTLEAYKRRTREVEAYLNGMEIGIINRMQQLTFVRGYDGGRKTVEEQVKELAAVLREMESGINGVASKVTSTREQIQDVIIEDTGISSSKAWGHLRY